MFEELREKYKTFIYKYYDIKELEENILITYCFEIKDLVKFEPTISFSKKIIKNNNIDKDLLDYLVFHLGLIELISYWKSSCSKEVIIEAGYLDKEQIEWFKKLYFLGLGEFFYTNQIKTDIDSFMNIECKVKDKKQFDKKYVGVGNLIPIGGGKDSVVTLELLSGLENDTFIINPKQVMLDCSKLAGYDNPWVIYRKIDKNLIELNKQGFLNGHTPFSALVAFLSYLISYLGGKKYIILSNESSANEPNIIGTQINHQYSKSFEFENDFNNYTKKYFKIDIEYFSLLRPLLEMQIAYLFSKYEKYHQVFRSCNVGSKGDNWNWCLDCPKCLFVYIMLSPFLSKEKLTNMFGMDLLDKKELLETFKQLTGNSKNKPFECVGTYEEVNYALSLVIENYNERLPYLLQYYKNNCQINTNSDLLKRYDKDNNLNKMFESILKENYDR